MSQRIALALSLLAVGRVHAEPFELGQSTRPGGRHYAVATDLEIIPIYWRRTHRIVDWAAAYDGLMIDHEQFYRLVDRPELARRLELHQDIGIAAMVVGVVVAGTGIALGIKYKSAPVGFGMLGGGGVLAMAGLVTFGTGDPVTPPEAEELADYYNAHKFELGIGGGF